MNSTALGAKKENINFISEAHEKFYYEKIQKVREADVYHKALCYCLGMNEDTRRNVDRIYNFKTGCVKPECFMKAGRPVEVQRLSEWHSICTAMVHRAWMMNRTQRSRWMSVGDIQ